ncbi:MULTISPECIES: GNAT family N-acetyltransferase [Streptomyces]|uniref:GNAT family N-acetyltransferase n=1 Tax=Streptomyces TaxID=1883 RepID=UPI000AD911BF|nr:MULTISPECIES: GNAT family N-acetyltransferase [Streptomyces]
MLTVQPVRGRRMVREFLAMAGPLYRDDPRWVPPLTLAARRFMSPRHNPYHREAETEHFLAVDRGRVLGRISTTRDPGYVERYGDVGFFGWFESTDDQEVATALLETAEDWARERGLTKVAGPYSYCSTQEFGLLVDGFDTVPAAFQPHNPPYYAGLVEGAGYTEAYRTDTFSWGPDDDRAMMERVVARGERVLRSGGFRVRDLDSRRWDAELDLLYELFRASFAGNHEVIPMSRPVFDYNASELKDFLDPRLVRIVERDGTPVAFTMLLADPNEVLAAANGRLSPGFLLRYRKLLRQITGTVVLMIGARPELEGEGIGRILAAELAKVALGRVGGYRQVHTTWIHEENWQSRALVGRTGARPRRRYVVLEKELGPVPGPARGPRGPL